jgi:hypothetical protein
MAGVCLGLFAAAWTVRFVEPLLFGVRAYTAAIWVGAVLMLLLVGVAAALVPAMRASRLDPQRFLQQV